MKNLTQAVKHFLEEYELHRRVTAADIRKLRDAYEAKAATEIVDAIGEAWDLDTGIMHPNKFEKAVEAVQKILNQ
jgi:hypothetical protein